MAYHLTLSRVTHNTHTTQHKPQWHRLVMTVFSLLEPKLVADKLEHIGDENKELHKRLRGSEMSLAEAGHNAAEDLAQCQHNAADSLGRCHHDANTCRSNAKEAARMAHQQATARNAELETTNAALNHTTLVWEHMERAC